MMPARTVWLRVAALLLVAGCVTPRESSSNRSSHRIARNDAITVAQQYLRAHPLAATYEPSEPTVTEQSDAWDVAFAKRAAAATKAQPEEWFIVRVDPGKGTVLGGGTSPFRSSRPECVDEFANLAAVVNGKMPPFAVAGFSAAFHHRYHHWPGNSDLQQLWATPGAPEVPWNNVALSLDDHGALVCSFSWKLNDSSYALPTTTRLIVRAPEHDGGAYRVRVPDSTCRNLKHPMAFDIQVAADGHITFGPAAP